jgi:hypothetical protein
MSWDTDEISLALIPTLIRLTLVPGGAQKRAVPAPSPVMHHPIPGGTCSSASLWAGLFFSSKASLTLPAQRKQVSKEWLLSVWEAMPRGNQAKCPQALVLLDSGPSQ